MFVFIIHVIRPRLTDVGSKLDTYIYELQMSVKFEVNF